MRFCRSAASLAQVMDLAWVALQVRAEMENLA